MKCFEKLEANLIKLLETHGIIPLQGYNHQFGVRIVSELDGPPARAEYVGEERTESHPAVTGVQMWEGATRERHRSSI